MLLPLAYAFILALLPLVAWRAVQTYESLARFVGFNPPLRRDISHKLMALAVFWYLGGVNGAYYHASLGNWNDAFALAAIVAAIVVFMSIAVLDQPNFDAMVAQLFWRNRPRRRALIVFGAWVFYTLLLAWLALTFDGAARWIAIATWVVFTPVAMRIAYQHWRVGGRHSPS